MKKILLSILTIALVTTIAIGATRAYFSDTETSNGNTFVAGTLDLTVDGNNGVNTVEFNLTNLYPGYQPNGGFPVSNIGSVNGYLNLTSITVTNNENNCIEPETEAGDTSCNVTEGELGSVLNLRLFVDRNSDGWISTGEPVLYNGPLSDVPAALTFNEALNAGANSRIGAILDWWSSANDNKAQGDSAVLNMTFSLSQNSL